MSSTSMFRGFHSLHCPKAFWAVIYATALWGTFLSPCLPSHISCLFFLDLWGLNRHIHSINFIISFNWKLRKGIFVGCHKEPCFHRHFFPHSSLPRIWRRMPFPMQSKFLSGMHERECVCLLSDWLWCSSRSLILSLIYQAIDVRFQRGALLFWKRNRSSLKKPTCTRC